MKVRYYLTTCLLLVFCLSSVSAQKAKLNRANRMFNDLNFQDAITLYLEILDKRDISEAKINLADSYRLVGDWNEAEYWYGQVVRVPEAKDIHRLYYGMALQANGKCDQAKTWFDEYSKLVPEDIRGSQLSKACDETMISELMEKGALYKIEHLAKLNTSFDDFGAAYYKDGLVFSSERFSAASSKRIHTWTGYPFLELFWTKRKLVDESALEYKYSKPDRYSGGLNSKFHDGPVSFSRDFEQIFFTRNNLYKGKIGKDDEGVIRLKIFSSTIDKDGKWGTFESLPFNSDEYSVAHPALSPGGDKLYFTSDMPGGFGGMDLYVSYLESGRWSPPINLGPVVNTEGNEVFPYVHEDGTLYFASNGQVGLGGLDVFYSREIGGTWAPAINVGYPINTRDDDFGLILNEAKTHGYFSSDREGGAGRDDVYSFTKFAANVEVLVYEDSSGKPLENAVVTSPQMEGRTFTTGIDGKVVVEMPLDKALEFTATKEGYDPNSTTASTKMMDPGAPVFVKIPLNQPIQLEVTGFVRDEDNATPLAGVDVILENDCGQETQTTTTGLDGSYSFELNPDCCYIIKMRKDDYLSRTDRFCTEGRQDDPVIALDIPLPPIRVGVETKSFELEHIYYDFDKAYIRNDAEPGLDRLLKILTDNPTAIVEIGSHTDARGANRYNERLSARRAEAVVRYLIQKGVAKARLRAKGYGETITVNGCINKVQCTEEQHQRNRRTEFRVVGFLDGKDTNSAAPDVITTDPCKGCPF